MNPETLVKVIDACGKNGVSQFKSGNIRIEFNGFVNHTKADYSLKVAPIGENVKVDPNFRAQESVEAAAEDTESLIITDPQAYEEGLFRNEFEDSE